MARRRDVLAGAAIALLAPLIGTRRAPAAEKFATAHSDAEWQKLLTQAQYDVLRRQGTEAPFSSPLDHETATGIYACAGCATKAFSSATKYDSGTGWPSFYEPIPGAVETASDDSLFMQRTEVHCTSCGGHLGHVFPDGPRPTGLRYCMNGTALNFSPTKV